MRADQRWVTKWQEVQWLVWGGCLALQRQRSSQALNTEARRWWWGGGTAPKWCFIFSASTLGRLHPGSRSRLWGFPLIPLDPPLSPLQIVSRSCSCHHFVLFAQYYSGPAYSQFTQPAFTLCLCTFCLWVFHIVVWNRHQFSGCDKGKIILAFSLNLYLMTSYPIIF